MKTIEVDLTRQEIDQLAKWHEECEKRCAEMREYGLADEHKDRTYLFNGLRHSGKYMEMT